MRTIRIMLVVGVVIIIARAHAALNVISVDDSSFTPDNLQIDPNDDVRWELVGGAFHGVTSGTTGNTDGLWDTVITALTPHTRTFGEVGVFPYLGIPAPDPIRIWRGANQRAVGRPRVGGTERVHQLHQAPAWNVRCH